MSLPELRLPLDGTWIDLPPFRLADGSGPALQATQARVAADARGLHTEFVCEDLDIWGTFRHRDEPIYDEECVEVFLAPEADDPVDYYEFEVSPFGVLLDALIHNPSEEVKDRRADFAWNAEGVEWSAAIEETRARWTARLSIPWAALGFPGVEALPSVWRANFYRIERPRDGTPPEFSGWSPTLTEPANFHVPARFGTLRLVRESPAGERVIPS